MIVRNPYTGMLICDFVERKTLSTKNTEQIISQATSNQEENYGYYLGNLLKNMAALKKLVGLIGGKFLSIDIDLKPSDVANPDNKPYTFTKNSTFRVAVAMPRRGVESFGKGVGNGPELKRSLGERVRSSKSVFYKEFDLLAFENPFSNSEGQQNADRRLIFRELEQVFTENSPFKHTHNAIKFVNYCFCKPWFDNIQEHANSYFGQDWESDPSKCVYVQLAAAVCGIRFYGQTDNYSYDSICKALDEVMELDREHISQSGTTPIEIQEVKDTQEEIKQTLGVEPKISVESDGALSEEMVVDVLKSADNEIVQDNALFDAQDSTILND